MLNKDRMKLYYNGAESVTVLEKYLERICSLQNNCDVNIEIDVNCISDQLCCHIKDIFGVKKSCVKEVTIVYNTLCVVDKEMCDLIIKLLGFIKEIDSLILNIENNMHPNKISADIIKTFLCHASTQHLTLDIDVINNNEFREIAITNAKIKNMMVKTRVNKLNMISFSQIDKINGVIVDTSDYKTITTHTITKMTNLSPNLTNIIFIGNGYGCLLFTPTAIEYLINFVTSCNHIDKLEFRGCFDSKYVQYMCDAFINVNIQAIYFSSEYKNIGRHATLSITNLIKNNKSIHGIKIGYIRAKFTDAFFEILKGLADTNITYFSAVIESPTSDIPKVHDNILNCLEKNYSLLNMHIWIYTNTFRRHHVCTDSITNRNNELHNNKRFVRTKVAAPTNS